MPRKPNPPKAKGKPSAELSDAVAKLQTRYKVLTSDIATLKWVGGIALAVVILLSTAVIQFSLHNTRENADLRRENIEIRADHNALRLEFEIYKSQNPQ